MKKLSLVFVLLASLLAACGGSPTAVSTLQPTQTARVEVVVVTATPAATEIVVEQVETPEPTATGTAVPTATTTVAPAQYVIPLSWFASQGIDFNGGVTVAYNCEVGARAWQGSIPFTTVPIDSKIELVEVDCVQYGPGETIPQDILNRMKGMGTIWFLVPIEGTESQKGDCPCVGEDC